MLMIEIGNPYIIEPKQSFHRLALFNKNIISAHTSISFLSYDCVCCYPIFSLNKIIFFLSLSNCNLFIFSPQMNHLFLYASLSPFYIPSLWWYKTRKKLLKQTKRVFFLFARNNNNKRRHFFRKFLLCGCLYCIV